MLMNSVWCGDGVGAAAPVPRMCLRYACVNNGERGAGGESEESEREVGVHTRTALHNIEGGGGKGGDERRQQGNRRERARRRKETHTNTNTQTHTQTSNSEETSRARRQHKTKKESEQRHQHADKHTSQITAHRVVVGCRRCSRSTTPRSRTGRSTTGEHDTTSKLHKRKKRTNAAPISCGARAAVIPFPPPPPGLRAHRSTAAPSSLHPCHGMLEAR